MLRPIATVALALGILLCGAPAAEAEPPPRPPAVPAAASDEAMHDLEDDMVGPAAPGTRGTAKGLASRSRIRYWPGRTIRYHETLPAKWEWSLNTAVRHWNQTGARIKLVEVPTQRRSQLVIRYGPTGGAAGIGTLGYAPGHNIVHLSAEYKRVNEHNPEQRVWVALLLAHEIGHNLGYNHTRGRCVLMAPVFFFGPCGPLSDDKPGYYRCRVIDQDLLRRHVRTYGGRRRQQPADCLIAPLPPRLQDVTLTGGAVEDDSIVRLSWRVTRPPEKAKIRVRSWKARTCGTAPASAFVKDLPATATSWREPQRARGPWCYSLQIRNRYGAARPPVTRSVVRSLPVPDPPVVTEGPVFDPDSWDHRFRASVPTGATLVAMRDYANPGRCVTAHDPDLDEELLLEPDGWYHLYFDTPTECVVLFAVGADGLAGDGVVLRPPPAPTVRPTVGQVTVDEWGDRYVRVSLGANPQGYDVYYKVVSGSCPATAPDPDNDSYAYLDEDNYLWTSAEGPHCAVFAAFDSFGRPGPVVTRTFTVTGG